MSSNQQTIVFGGGCFWCTEAVFARLKGVIGVMPGYAGGSVPNPTYEQVCGGATGHAEVIKIDYDAAVISLEDLLTVFFATHNPTTRNRQGNDMGTQYRSIVFYSTEDQKTTSERFIQELNKSGDQAQPVVTELKPLDKFYPAEDYHQKYYEKNKDQPYCEVVINPKIEKLKSRFYELLK